MDLHVADYYSAQAEPGPHGHFRRVIALHENPIQWSEVHQLVPSICRGWYELAHLSVQDRIEFTRDFWLTKLPYHPNINEFLFRFFSSLDDIGIFLTQERHDDPFIPHLVYSLKDNGGFYQGATPASDVDILALQKELGRYSLPADYLAFLQIHNGFAKLTDTGIITSSKMKESYDCFQKALGEVEEPLTTMQGIEVNPASLIPFYESFGMPFFQCFWEEWYPDQEMGNVYYSMERRKISTCEKKEECAETLAFQTFLDWLMFYLEKVE